MKFTSTDANLNITVLQVCITVFRTLSLWPAKGKSFRSTSYKCKLVVFAIMTLVTTIGALTDAIYLMLHFDTMLLDDILTNVTAALSAFNIIGIVSSFLLHRKNVLQLAQDISNFERFPEPPLFKKMNTIMNKVTKLLVVYTLTATVIYAMFSLLQRKTCWSYNTAFELYRLCDLFLPLPEAVLPDLAQRPPFSQIFFAIQGIGAGGSITGAFTIILFMCGFVDLLRAHIIQLKHNMSQAFDVDNEMERRKRLKYSVQYHEHILNMTQQLNDSFGTTTFINVTFTGLVLGVLCFQFIIKPQVRTFLHAGGWVVALFVQCFFSQRLINESEDIPNYIYFTDWFTSDVKCQKYLLMIIARGNQHLYVDTNGFGPVGLLTFSKAINGCYSLITLLHSSQEE